MKEQQTKLNQLKDRQRAVEVEVKRLEAREAAERQATILEKHKLWLIYQEEAKALDALQVERKTLQQELSQAQQQQQPLRDQIKYDPVDVAALARICTFLVHVSVVHRRLACMSQGVATAREGSGRGVQGPRRWLQ